MFSTVLLLATLHAINDNCCHASEDCCYVCPKCCQDLCKVCRPECGKKDVPKITFKVECEDFCVPGLSCKNCCLDECGHCQTCLSPSCGKVRTRKKLVKVEEKTEVALTKCVVELECPCCHKRYKLPSKEGDKQDAGKQDASQKDGDKKGAEKPKEPKPPTAPAEMPKPAEARRGIQRLGQLGPVILFASRQPRGKM